MKLDLAPDAEGWVEAEVARGRFASAEAAVEHAIRLAKLDLLRRDLVEADAEGGAFSADDVRRFALSCLGGPAGSAGVER